MKKTFLTIVFIICFFTQANAIYFDDESAIEEGYRGFIEWDYTLGVGEYPNNLERINFYTSHGCQIAPQFFIGAGASFSYYYDIDKFGIPLYVHMRRDLLNSDITPFIDMKVGYSVCDINGVYLNPSIGCRFALNESLGLNVGIGYTFNKCRFEYYYGEKKVNIGGINFRIGIDF